MSLTTRKGKYPHTKWIDLKGDGIMHECAILKEDNNGNNYYIELGLLDSIDKTRMAQILSHRSANSFELWDLMSTVTLNNGVNALTYFHQFVKVISQDGKIYSARSGVIGSARNFTKPTVTEPSKEVLNADVKQTYKTVDDNTTQNQ